MMAIAFASGHKRLRQKLHSLLTMKLTNYAESQAQERSLRG